MRYFRALGAEGDEEVDVITTATEAPRVRNAEELATLIKTANGKLTVDTNSSNLIVALNNQMRFAVTRLPDGHYELTDRLAGDALLYLGLGAAALVLVLVLAKS